MDIWLGRDGARWEQVSDSPWIASLPEHIKYDFDALVARSGPGKLAPAIYTFGGDRETFDFTDPNNYRKVDDDVWQLAPSLQDHVDIDVQISSNFWHNTANALDVNGDDHVAPDDLPGLINEYNTAGHHGRASGRFTAPTSLNSADVAVESLPRPGSFSAESWSTNPIR